VFDPFRTRAIRPLVEVHFFAILTVDGRRERRYSVRIRWCCTHPLRESVTDAEQLMMVASRASINRYLGRAGKRSAMRTSIISLGLAADCSQST
jgi:hypothetical protein